MRVFFKKSDIKLNLCHKIDLTFEFYATETKNPLSEEGICFFFKPWVVKGSENHPLVKLGLSNLSGIFEAKIPSHISFLTLQINLLIRFFQDDTFSDLSSLHLHDRRLRL